MTVQLPEKFRQKMKDLLQEEYEDYLSSFDHPSYTAIRINTNKISVEEFQRISPFPLRRVPWCRDAFYVEEKSLASKHPYYYAGLYYIQEPSAMLPSEVLPVEEGDAVLDVCAAPGGKSIRLATKLHNTGILVSNDISISRCQALVKNLERFGVRNSVVTCGSSSEIAPVMQSAFDAVLVDAPCSGEGMFRKEHALISAYEKRDSSYYVPIQKQVIQDALSMLKEGGYLVYSTCTFSREEDEDIIQYALSLDPSLNCLPIPCAEGFVQNAYGTKLFPHKVQGEGHFVSLLQKGDRKKEKKEKRSSEVQWNFETVHYTQSNAHLFEKKDRLYAVPYFSEDLSSLRIVRSGVQLAEKKNGRWKLAGTLAMSLTSLECTNRVLLHAEDTEVWKYLKGETLLIKQKDLLPGTVLVTCDGYPLGFASYKNGILKNGYPKGWIYR